MNGWWEQEREKKKFEKQARAYTPALHTTIFSNFIKLKGKVILKMSIEILLDVRVYKIV